MHRAALLAAAVTFSCIASADVVDPKRLPPVSAARWFNLSKTSNGWVAGGTLGKSIWAFAVQGNELRDFPNTSSPTFSIDGVVLQVKAVPRAAFPARAGRSMLDSHRRSEQDYEQKTTKGEVRILESNTCAAAKVPHLEWIAQSPTGIARLFVTFAVGDHVLMVVSPYENEQRRGGVERMIADACRSFSVGKAG